MDELFAQESNQAVISKSCCGERIAISREWIVSWLTIELFRVTIIISQHPAQPFATFDVAYHLPDLISGIDDLVVESLVISLFVVMSKILANRVSQHVLTEEDHAI